MAETGELQINFDSTPPSPIYGENTISAFTNIEPDSVEFRVMGPQNSIFPGIANSPTNYYFVWDTTSFLDGNYYVKAIAQKETIETYTIFNVNVENSSSSSTPPEITVRTEDNQIILQGTKYFYADISTGHSLNDLIFYLGDYSFHGGVSPDLSSWSAMLDTSVLPDGKYNFYAKGLYDGTLYNSQNDISVTIDNAGTDLAVEFIDLPSSPLSGDQTFYTQTSGTVNSVTFKVIPGIDGTEYTPYPGSLISGSIDKYSFIWPTGYFPDGSYQLRVLAYDRISYVDAYTNYFQVQNETTSGGDSSSSDGTTTTNQTIEITVSESGNRKDFLVVSNMPLENVMFHFDNLSDSTSSVQFPGTPTNTTDLTNWTLALTDSDLISNIDYNFYASGYFEGTLHSSINDILIPANNSSSTTDPTGTDLAIEFTSIPPSAIYGDNTISAVTNIEPDSVEFRVSGPKYSTFTGIKNSPNNYHFLWDTVNFPDGNYYVKAIAKKGTLETYTSFNVNVENTSIDTTTTEPLILTFVERFETPLFGDQRISISSNQEIDGCILGTFGPKLERFLMIKDSPTKYHIILHTKNFPNGDYTIKATAKDGIGTIVDTRLDIKIENLIAPKPDQPIITEPILDEPILDEPILDEPKPTYPIEPIKQPIIEPITEPIPIT
ncbi:MAG: hypothetical protein KAR08_08760, partial [Candidatus Heimdallarchaeota archaeon]|nr:hypothetical protein [Candidatus Heimdallarchaeota archaeon]